MDIFSGKVTSLGYWIKWPRHWRGRL